MKHRVIDGRIYRDVELPAADVNAAKRHISAEPPISSNEQIQVRLEAEIARRAEA